MSTKTDQNLITCDNCRLPLPIRRAAPGEVGSSWQCVACGARYFGVLDFETTPDSINNVTAATEPNPRVMVGRELVAALHRRAPLDKPVMDSRQHPRKVSTDNVTVRIDNVELPARSIDVSLGGIGCVVPVDVECGQEVMLRFADLPGAPQCRGVIRACDKWEDGYRLGIEFVR